MEHAMAHERRKLIEGDDRDRSEEPSGRPPRRNTGRLGKWYGALDQDLSVPQACQIGSVGVVAI
jgi:hypothetical protein